MIFFSLDMQAQPFEPFTQQIDQGTLQFDFVPVEGGQFMMGSNVDSDDTNPNESPIHEVQVDDFWMGVYEVDWEQFDVFVFQELDSISIINEKDLSALGIDAISGASTPYVDMSFNMGKENYPAVNMTQYGAIMFCKWLTAKTGVFYRLPTEAEWEYACKKGALGPEVPLTEKAWFKKNAAFAYEEIGTKIPDSLGIYDLLGNVNEWVLDQYDTSFYRISPIDNPLNRPETLYPRVVRGGSWKDKEERVTCTGRQFSKPRWKRRDPQVPKSRWWLTSAPMVGFRLVRPKIQPPGEEIAKYWLDVMDDYQ